MTKGSLSLIRKLWSTHTAWITFIAIIGDKIILHNKNLNWDNIMPKAHSTVMHTQDLHEWKMSGWKIEFCTTLKIHKWQTKNFLQWKMNPRDTSSASCVKSWHTRHTRHIRQWWQHPIARAEKKIVTKVPIYMSMRKSWSKRNNCDCGNCDTGTCMSQMQKDFQPKVQLEQAHVSLQEEAAEMSELWVHYHQSLSSQGTHSEMCGWSEVSVFQVQTSLWPQNAAVQTWTETPVRQCTLHNTVTFCNRLFWYMNIVAFFLFLLSFLSMNVFFKRLFITASICMASTVTFHYEIFWYLNIVVLFHLFALSSQLLVKMFF